MRKDALLYEKLDQSRVHCLLCAHECRIADGKPGFCGVRLNEGGVLKTLVYGDAIAANVDPIEKKPLYHFLPGTKAFSLATAGCNFRCSFCQNWQISQLTGDQADTAPHVHMMPEDIVSRAVTHRCASIAYTYTEPTVFFEYAYDTAEKAAEQGIRNVFVTNGYMTRNALETIQPFLDAANVDLKSFRDDYYRRLCKARLAPVLDSIRTMKELGIWVEVTTLVVPDENDSESELTDIAQFIAGVDRGIPWHISRFHPEYEYDHQRATPLSTLETARAIGQEAGLDYIYLGNVASDPNTYCPECGDELVRRDRPPLGGMNIANGVCASCGAVIPGVWQ
mgnify:CR=1 FL=1